MNQEPGKNSASSINPSLPNEIKNQNFYKSTMDNQLTYISLGGVGEVTKNLHLYQHKDEILIVDCGLGFPDETMVGIDLLLPDISYLLKALQNNKKIVGMVITHGHEDHMGALPFILPQLPEFPIYATNFTAALANEKLKEFGLKPNIQKTEFNKEVRIGSFTASFIRVTHSIMDTAHIFIQTPVGNFYHGSDFKFDLTPHDGQKTDFSEITKLADKGVRCLMSECLGSERTGITPSEDSLSEHFEIEMRKAKGKFIVTTYSSNISRLNQIMEVAEKLNKYVCFVGRSLINTKNIARQEGLLRLKKEREIQIDQVKKYPDRDLLLFVAGSQGQENSALSRIITGDHRDISVKNTDTIVFSADPIPGNEISVGSLIDLLSKLGVRVLYSGITHDFHVSGHGSAYELMLLMSLTNPKQVLPISGGYRQMAAYRNLAESFGFNQKDIILTASGQEVIFTREHTSYGQKIPMRHVYVDEISGEEIEQYVLHDRQKISQEGIVAIIVEIDDESGAIAGKPEVVSRGVSAAESQNIESVVSTVVINAFKTPTKMHDWNYIRKQIREISEKAILKQLKRHPLVLPVVIEI